ncbi:hypothetical protein BCR34DRAFT_130762 [Clohesyomyces aquaticus]|uniref:Uncharacterized protein n=1 Tax=Clohesyomyces aquaticus TaxID=1231657 RepID=A0A1Y2ABT2_9PLEO|nr:hypothetical protein BCR34DRAFT_130762 [Clohesyomyces aquaticus]
MVSAGWTPWRLMRGDMSGLYLRSRTGWRARRASLRARYLRLRRRDQKNAASLQVVVSIIVTTELQMLEGLMASLIRSSTPVKTEGWINHADRHRRFHKVREDGAARPPLAFLRAGRARGVCGRCVESRWTGLLWAWRCPETPWRVGQSDRPIPTSRVDATPQYPAPPRRVRLEQFLDRQDDREE